MKWLIRILMTKRKSILLNAAREICSTAEGQEFARKFLYAPGHEYDGFALNANNQKYEFYEPLKTFFENCG